MTRATGTVRLETDARGVARITLARAARHNAMDRAMIDALAAVAAEIAARSGPGGDIRAAVLAAEGPSFCAGGDLDWMRAQMAADRATRMEAARALAEMLGALDALPVPLVARVQGRALGGGLGLVAVADVALAAEDAEMALTETRLGLIPATIAPFVLARTGARSRGAFLTGRRIAAGEAVALGLLARAVPAGELDAAVEAEIAPALACAPGAVADAKRLMRRLLGSPGPEAVEATVAALANRWETAEAEAGIAAFFERRPPPWAAG